MEYLRAFQHIAQADIPSSYENTLSKEGLA